MPPPPARCLIVADAHLGQVPESVARAFHAFLDAVPQPGDELVVNGDLFDFWFEYGTVVPRRHIPTVMKLAGLVQRGIPVTFLGGNHDRWGGDFLRRDMGIGYHSGAAELVLAGRRALVVHGDGLTEQHWSGALLHWLLRQPLTVALFRMLHPAIGFWIADRLSGTLADNTKDKAVLDRAAAAQAAYAQALLTRRTDLSLVVMAHTHRARLEHVDGGRAYVNPGAFLDGGRYAVVTADTVELKTFAT
ncbi:MAG TPA: UDP-2,3-diacylglucosamine diphosphatase [Gemmatimonadales bacterium]|nr:UDP-2,3-diacylglucosamine diphosphatase [Gemmatimonadales bacterium]